MSNLNVMLEGLRAAQGRIAEIEARAATLTRSAGGGASASFSTQLAGAMGQVGSTTATAPAANTDLPSGPSQDQLNGYQLPATEGRISTFGGPDDTMAGGKFALTGEDPVNPKNPWFIAMRWPRPDGKYPDWLKDSRIILEYQGRKVCVRPADYGPAAWTGRVVDVGPDVLKALGADTDSHVKISWATDQNMAYGPVN